MCLYRPKARWGGELDKDSQRTTAGELQKIVESRGQKTFKKNCKTAPTSPHVVWEGFKKYSPNSFKNKLQHIQLSDTTGTSNETCFYGQIEKMSFLTANTQDGLVNTGIKSTPCVQLNILLYFWGCGPIFLLEVLDILFRHMAAIKYKQIKKSISGWLIFR